MAPTTAPTPTTSPPPPLGQSLIRQWALDPSIAFLNHGCFGATPREVLDLQQSWRERFEARPVEMLDRKRDELVAAARRDVARFLGADADDLVFVTNATGAINAVLRSLEFRPGDELLSVDHVYNAVRQTLRYVARRAGASSIELTLAVPMRSREDVVTTIARAITPRTRVIVICHITSPTALLMPVEEVIELAAARGVDVLVDGAHAPGSMPLDLNALGAAWYAGNLHKWACAPKGCAFLWSRRDRQDDVHPTTISHHLDEGFVEEFNWQGTRDITPWLCAPAAIAFLGRFGWERVMRHNHEMATWVQAMLARAWNVEPLSPHDGSMLASMAAVLVPERLHKRFDTAAALQARLYDEHHIEVPIVEWNDRWLARICCQIYNTADQYERLRDAVSAAAE